MNKFKIRMGAKVTDKVSGFQGIVTGRAEYSTGCRQYCVVPSVSKEGALQDAHWFDEDRLLKKPAKKKNDGGPQSCPAPLG